MPQKKMYFSTYTLCFVCVCVCVCVCVSRQHNNTSGLQTPCVWWGGWRGAVCVGNTITPQDFKPRFQELFLKLPVQSLVQGPAPSPTLRESTSATTGSWVALTLRWPRLSLTPQTGTPPTHTFSKGCWGPWCAPDAAPRVLSTGVAPRRPLTRYQEEEGRRGRKGTNGCSRPHQKGPLTWDLAARSGGRSTRSLRSFRACAPTGAAILSRKPARGS